jgi:hypothetical protein
MVMISLLKELGGGLRAVLIPNEQSVNDTQ